MRRALCSLSALLILALSLLIAGNAALSGRAAAFSAEIEPLSGSPAAAEGLTLSLSASLASQLYWGADYSVGSGGFDTRFSYGEAIDCRDDSSGRSVYGVEFGSGTFFSGSLSDNDAIDAIFSGLAERALAAGAGRYEDYSETIYLADYFDYYPVDAHAIPSSEREGFAEFFRVPVLPGDSIDVSVSGVTPGGGASSLGMSSNDNTVYLALQSVETGTADYLAFDSSNPWRTSTSRTFPAASASTACPTTWTPASRSPPVWSASIRWTRRSCTPCTSTPPTTASCCSPPSSPSPGT